MAKADFPPILQPGIHQMTLDDIWDSCVSPLPLAQSRIGLFNLFGQWIHRLRQLNVVGTIWLDGSFVTRKPVPGDLDCVLWHPAFCAPLSDAGKIKVRNMTDQAAARALHGIDLYIEASPGGRIVDTAGLLAWPVRVSTRRPPCQRICRVEAMSLEFLERHAQDLQREARITAERSAAAPDDFWLEVAAKNQQDAAHAAMRTLEIEYARETGELFEIRLTGPGADPALSLDTFLNFFTPLNRAWKAAAFRLYHGVQGNSKSQVAGKIIDIGLAGLSQRPPHVLLIGRDADDAAGVHLLRNMFTTIFQLLSPDVDDFFDAVNAIGVDAALDLGEALVVVQAAAIDAEFVWRHQGAILTWRGSQAEVSRIKTRIDTATDSFTYQETLVGALAGISEGGQLALQAEAGTSRIRFPLNIATSLEQFRVGTQISVKVQTTQFRLPSSKREVLKRTLISASPV